MNQAKRHKLATGVVAVVLLAVITTAGYFAIASRQSINAGPINSITVMPFVNASGKSEVEYLSDGLTDSLIFRFSQLPNVKVSPTSSVMRLKGTTQEVADVAKELDVDAVLTGSIMQVADNLVPSDSPFGWMSVVVVAYAYAKQGKRADAEQQLSLLRELGKTRYIRTYYLTAIYGTLGDKDKAFAELEKSLL